MKSWLKPLMFLVILNFSIQLSAQNIKHVTPGTGRTSLGKAEDAPAASGDTGVAILVRRCDVEGITSDTDGDYTTPCVDADGNLRVAGDFAIGAIALPAGASTSALQGGGLPAALGAGGGLKVDGSGVALPVADASAASIDAKMTSGTDIGDVTINNADGAAVYVQPKTGSQWTTIPATADAEPGNVRTNPPAPIAGDDYTTDCAGATPCIRIPKVGADGTQWTHEAPQTAGGYSKTHLISAATMNATLVKGSAGQLYGWYVTNINASPCYVKFFDHVDAPDPSVDSADVFLNLMIPGSTAGGGTTQIIPAGIPVTAGLGFVITTVVADNDETAVAANEVVVNVFYK